MKKINTEKKQKIRAVCWRTAAWTLRVLALAVLTQLVVGAIHSATIWEGLHHVLRFTVPIVAMLGCATSMDYRYSHYRCKKCGHIHEYNEENKAVFASFEMDMECPSCGERSLNKRAFRKPQTVNR